MSSSYRDLTRLRYPTRFNSNGEKPLVPLTIRLKIPRQPTFPHDTCVLSGANSVTSFRRLVLTTAVIGSVFALLVLNFINISVICAINKYFLKCITLHVGSDYQPISVHMIPWACQSGNNQGIDRLEHVCLILFTFLWTVKYCLQFFLPSTPYSVSLINTVNI